MLSNPAPVAWSTWLGLTLLVSPAAADVFRFQDGQGVVHYTNAPNDPRYRRLLGYPETPSPAPAAPGAPLRALARFAPLIQAAAERYRVERRLVEAVIMVESGGNPRAVSRKGARGLMQLMPERSEALGVRNPFSPAENIDGGVRHLRDLLAHFRGEVTHALAAYNAGADAVRTYGGVPPYPETQGYVRKVRALYEGRPDSRWTAPAETPQLIYRQVGADGTIVYTNLPPAPTASLLRRF